QPGRARAAALAARLRGLRGVRREGHDRAAAALSDAGLADCGWRAVRGADRDLVLERALALHAQRTGGDCAARRARCSGKRGCHRREGGVRKCRMCVVPHAPRRRSRRADRTEPRLRRDFTRSDWSRLPWFFKRYSDSLPRVALPRELPSSVDPAQALLAGRAKVRRAELDLPQLSRLLHLTAGVVRTAEWPPG